MTRPHVLDVDGAPQTGVWRCTRCLRTFAYYADALGTDCGRLWPWSTGRIARFRARARSTRTA